MAAPPFTKWMQRLQLVDGTGLASRAFADWLGKCYQSITNINGQLPVVGQLPGTETNDNASGGNVGEFLSSSIAAAAAVPLTSTIAADITSITLSAGDWDVWGTVIFLPAAGTTMSLLEGWTSTVSATVPAAPNGGAFAELQLTFTTAAQQAMPVGQMRQSVAAATNIFLSVSATFAVSTMKAYGFIGARRRR